jgi:hypothetical protein
MADVDPDRLTCAREEMKVDRLTWPTAVRALVGILVAGFVAGSVLNLVLNFDVLGAPPEPPEDFIDGVIASFEFDATRWPVEFAASALFAAGFAALGLLGPTLGRLTRPADVRRGLLSGSFLLAGGLGVASQLMWIGAKPIAASTQYCECGLLAEEIMSRLMALNIVGGMQMWLVNGAAIMAAIGLVVAVGTGLRAGMPSGWGLLAWGTALLVIVTAVLSAFRAYPFDLIGTVLVAAILVPAWAIWIAMEADRLVEDDQPA